jgi:hypothetical protein
MVVRSTRNGVLDFLLFRRDRAQSDASRWRSMPELMVERPLTSTEEAIYWQAYHSGLAEAYANAVREVSQIECASEPNPTVAELSAIMKPWEAPSQQSRPEDPAFPHPAEENPGI